jgi:hypothetical protein
MSTKTYILLQMLFALVIFVAACYFLPFKICMGVFLFIWGDRVMGNAVDRWKLEKFRVSCEGITSGTNNTLLGDRTIKKEDKGE